MTAPTTTQKVIAIHPLSSTMHGDAPFGAINALKWFL